MEAPGDSGKPARRWFQRRQKNERRKAHRHALQGLVAYYWDGGEAVAHQIRDIGPSGMFLLTERHWYPGTLVTMTLQRSASAGAVSDSAISVQTRVVRQDDEGVGLAFVPVELRHASPGQPRDTRLADRKSLDTFLQSVLGSAD